jgi:hypothetical protein
MFCNIIENTHNCSNTSYIYNTFFFLRVHILLGFMFDFEKWS